jgi:hypothetical protein
MHSLHPDSHEHGLADDCPRCAEHAEHPFESLDDENLVALATRTVAWMRDEEYPRSETETTAMRYMERSVREARALLRLGVVRLPVGSVR